MVAQLCPLLCDHLDCSMLKTCHFFHYLLKFSQTDVHWIDDAIQPYLGLFHVLVIINKVAINISMSLIAGQTHVLQDILGSRTLWGTHTQRWDWKQYWAPEEIRKNISLCRWSNWHSQIWFCRLSSYRASEKIRSCMTETDLNLEQL